MIRRPALPQTFAQASAQTSAQTSGSDGGWVLQWWQAKASTFERVVKGAGVGACTDPDAVAAATVVRLLQARDYWELAHEASAAWSDVEALVRAGVTPRMLAAVAARIGLAFTGRLNALADEIACQSGDPDPNPNTGGHPPPGRHLRVNPLVRVPPGCR